MKNILFILLFLAPGFYFSQGGDCATADPFCSGTTYTFPNSTTTTAESGIDYGCLSSQPNPSWYYLQVANSGNIDLTVSQTSNAGSPIDVDFIAYGPFNDPVSPCASGLAGGSAVDCSYSTAATEEINIPNAQAGDFYLVLLTNFSGTAGTISLSQTGGSGSTDCSVLNCNLYSLDGTISACNSGTFDITGQVQFANAPTTGTLTISTCSGDQHQISAPFTSPFNYSITGITADGTAGCSVTAVFSADPACTLTTNTFTEPVCACAMTSFNASIGACDGVLNTYEVNGDVSFNNPPSTGNLVVEVDNGVTTYTATYPLPVTSPLNWDVLGIPADGSNITITAYFSADPACTINVSSTAPNSCICNAEAGTFSGSVAGVSTNDYVLCFGDQIDLSSNLDYTPPGDESITGVTYDPGIAYLVYTCPPSVFPTSPLWDVTTGLPNDPCLLGVASYGDNFSDQNVLGGPSYAGSFTNNIVYYVPITTYSNIDGYYAISINGGPWCYDMGTPFAVQYLPEIIATSVEDCNAGTATFTLNGGLPEVDGSNFTASNLLPGTASFGNSTTGNGGTIVINGLQDGDMYSFDILDANGCPQTFTGGPFVAVPTANAGLDDTECSLSYGLSATPSFGTGTWTGAGVTFTPNANSPTATATVTSAGSYTMTWTEDNGNGCTDSDDVIVQFSNLGYTDAVVQSTCGNPDGEITLTGNNGITAYQYSIDGGTTFQASGSFTGLLATTYNIVVQDNIGCQVTGTASVTDQSGPVINSVTAIDPQCNGGCDGSISINATGATQFSIDNGVTFQATNSFANLCAGNYEIVVANAVGCQATSGSLLNDPAALTYSSALTDLLCFGQCIGEIDVTASGGTGALQYSNDNGVTFGLNNVFGTLCAGNYDIVVEDVNGCQVTANEPITEPAPLTLTLGITNPICNSSCDGMINSIPAGGDGNYTYTWSNGQTVPLISNLCSGQYDLNIVDGNGCTIDTSVTLVGPAAAVINNVIEVDESCPGSCDGSLDVVASNVTQYSIDGVNFQAGSTFTNLCAGNYTVYAQDANACSVTAPAVVASPTALGANATSVSPICIDGSSLLSGSAGGGTAPYTYSWADNTGAIVFTTQNGNVSPVLDAIYTLTVTDNNGCTAATNTLVQVNDSLTLTVFGDTPICEGTPSNLSALAGGGDGGPYTYTWDQGLGVGQTQAVNPTQTTVYTVTVTDGCETPPISASVTIIVNTVPNISFTGDLLSGCAPVTTNFADNLVPAGSSCVWNFGDGGSSTQCGNPAYTFTEPGCWDVSLTITTAEGCVGTVSIPNYVCVFDYPVADFMFGPQPTTVMNPTIGFVNISSNADSYNWIFDVGGLEDQSTIEHPSYTFPTANSGTYEVCLEAVTAEGCTDTTCQNVVIDEEFIVYVPNAFSPDADLVNDIFIPVVKGVDELKYSFMVFNRWGELIFESSHPSLGWDGYHKGLLSQTDVYVWKLSCVDASSNKKHEFIGHVTLLK